ncbi:hypothetical protein [Stenotrophomonas sp. HMWF023]|uniref:hypothetical protein n=1 Tax=Stenotrophomonas sp. HMWF023 TaxID=2056859 RepID=UPI0011B24E25|nr:hypothetical protein [Stenotrophomonas sp. HMWF023]
MDAPVYTAVSSGSRLYVTSAAPDGRFAGYWCSASAAFEGTATLAQTWADRGGFYVFTQVVPADLGQFAAQLAQLAPRISPTGLVKVAWLANDADTSWNYWTIATLTALPQGAEEGPWATVTPVRWRLGDYAVGIPAGSRLTLQNSASGYGMSLPAAGVNFSHGDFSLTASGTPTLALAGPTAGALGVPLQLRAQQPDPFDRLGAMMRYATTPAADDAEAVAQNLARYLSMPVLRLASGTLTTALRFDPSALLDARRTYLDLNPAGGAPYALASAFMTTLGYTTTLTPRSGVMGVPSGRLAFGRSPVYAVEGPSAGNEVFHLTPDGSFSVNVVVPVRVQQRRAALLAASATSESATSAAAAAEQDLWMFGNSGAEYASLAPGGQVAVFAAGKPAWVPPAPTDGTSPLRTAATTAYMTLVPAAAAPGLTYFAQPLQAPLFRAASDLGAGFLDFHAMPSGTLPVNDPASDLSSQWLPAGAYRWLAPRDIELARQLEAAVLAPVRRAVIQGAPSANATSVGPEPGPAGTAAEPPAPALAVTPQGLLAQLSGDGAAWSGVLFANLPASSQALSFTPVKQRFAQALQSNQLFFVVADTQEFLEQSGAGPDGLDCTLDGWTFRLDPADWRTGAQGDPTLMLFKYCDRSLADLVDDTSAWGWRQAAGDVRQTQAQLQALLNDLRTRASAVPPVPGDPYVIFYNEVVNNPLWNGVLFFNAPVDLGKMPSELRFLAAGIDPKKFYAHHVGFSVTPIGGSGTIEPGQTAAFGLIDYEDPSDLIPSTTVPFGFKTLQLKLRFANARIADFAAQCQLMVNTLFGAPLGKQNTTRGNNLIMDGTCQRVAGVPAYSFALVGQNLFNAQGSAMTSVQVQSVRIDTVTADDDDAVTSSFTLQGNLRFREYTAFDIFGYGPDMQGNDGYLRFTGLSVRMQFRLSAPTEQVFTAFESATTLDPANSVPRAGAVASGFPLRIGGLEIATVGADGKGLTPEQMGFVSIGCPLDQTPMNAPWYGLTYTVDLGSLGALSGSIGMSMTVLAAWSTGPGDSPPVYVGIRFPSFVPGGGSLPLQGVLKLGFRGFEFIQYDAGGGVPGFQFWMRRFALSVLCWSFPPGNADLVLFGAPNDAKGSLGWYAAYDAKPDAATLQHEAADALAIPMDRHLANSRRTPPVA